MNDDRQYLEFDRKPDIRKVRREREIAEAVCLFTAIATIIYALCF
jgi:hypothetical protein